MNDIIPKNQNNAYTAACLPARFRPASVFAIPTAAIVVKATSAAAIFSWFGFIDFQGTTTDFLTIELLNR